jgi:protein ImuB
MPQRYVTIWFRYFKTDWHTRRNAAFANKPLVVYAPQHGRMVITAANLLAEQEGVYTGTVLADARAVITNLQAVEDNTQQFEKMIQQFAEWFIRYSPIVAVDGTDGLIIDASGCAHLWGGEEKYIEHISNRLKSLGYHIRIAMAGTIGAAWAITHYGTNKTIIANGTEAAALYCLPPQSLRITVDVATQLHKLGLQQTGQFISMPAAVLRRRFGNDFILRLQQALGYVKEHLQPVTVTTLYQERLPCIEPIVTLTGIEIALKQLLENICRRLQQAQKGVRTLHFICYRVDGKQQCLTIGTNRPTTSVPHLFKLFEMKLGTIEPALGIELFVLDALKTDEHIAAQEKIWNSNGALTDNNIALLLDRLANKIGEHKIHRYLPAAHYWPERSLQKVSSLDENTALQWNKNKPRPLKILSPPQQITVTAPVPDYPPMLFRYKNNVHKIVKADGPERIEQEWWLQQGEHRDYYYVEDEEGKRYWLFRLGHYDAAKPVGWYLHGYCA